MKDMMASLKHRADAAETALVRDLATTDRMGIIHENSRALYARYGGRTRHRSWRGRKHQLEADFSVLADMKETQGKSLGSRVHY